MFVVIQDGPFYKCPVFVFHSEEKADAFVERMNAKDHYKYYWEEVPLGD